MGPMLSTSAAILFDCAGVEMNLPKCYLNVLQAATIVDQKAAMHLVYDECQNLANVALATGFICVGTLVGSYY